MKKFAWIAFGIFLSAFSIANANGLTELHRKKDELAKGIIENGFFINFGMALPTQTVYPDAYTVNGAELVAESTPILYRNTQSLGVQPNIEIGNQWYFWKTEKLGFGLKVSWFQLGYSVYTANYNEVISGATIQRNIDLRVIKIAPQLTWALNTKMALDFSLDIAPTVFVGFGSTSLRTVQGNSTTLSQSKYENVSLGLLFAPGVRFRFNKFAAGFDIGLGSLPGSTRYTNATTTDYSPNSNEYLDPQPANFKEVVIKGNYFTLFPRIYLGLKF